MICETATKNSPWYVIPADNKSYARLAIASAIIKALDSLDLSYPEINDAQLDQLKAARKILEGE
jgi:hypothetical protein